MRGWKQAIVALAVTALYGTATDRAEARSLDLSVSGASAGIGAGDGSTDYLQCVPYARQVSGVGIYGDAWTWWDKAEGRYARGTKPKVGAVMSFPPHGAMRLGHVAAVSKVIDRRTVLLRHANWSPIDGRRGQIEDNVRAIDVSSGNDWSEVRVWFAPLGGLGTTHWPVNGFIYNERPKVGDRPVLLASAQLPAALDRAPYRSRIGSDFLTGIAVETAAPRTKAQPPRRALAYAAPATAETKATAPRGARSLSNDPIGRIIAARMR